MISTAGQSKAEGIALILQVVGKEAFYKVVWKKGLLLHNKILVCKGRADHGGQDIQWTLAVFYVLLFSFHG